jgi:hypothetical protein
MGEQRKKVEEEYATKKQREPWRLSAVVCVQLARRPGENGIKVEAPLALAVVLVVLTTSLHQYGSRWRRTDRR